MFHKQVCGSYLALAASTSAIGGASGGAVVLRHVDFEFVGVGAWWGLPAAVAVGRVEVIWQVLGLAVAHLPIRREAGLGLVVENERHVSELVRRRLVMKTGSLEVRTRVGERTMSVLVLGSTNTIQDLGPASGMEEITAK